MENLRFTTWEQNLTPEEIESVEKKLSVSFPDAMKKIYMTHNGGYLEDTFIFIPEKNKNIDIRFFFPIRYNKKYKNNPSYTLESIVLDDWKDESFPSNNFLFFATSFYEGHFYLDKVTQGIYYFDTAGDKDRTPLLVAPSFEAFLNQLIYIPSEKKAPSPPKRKRQPKLVFEDCGVKLKKADLQTVEEKLGVTLSDELKKFYIKFNGGKPNRVMYYGSDFHAENQSDVELEDMEVNRFLSMVQSDYMRVRLEEENLSSWENNTIPKNYIAFAIDHGDNVICQDINDGKIYYLVRDVWSDSLSDSDNFELNSTLLANSFNEFTKLLVLSDEDDE